MHPVLEVVDNPQVARCYVHPYDTTADVALHVQSLPMAAKLASGEVVRDERIPRGRPIVVLQGGGLQ